MRGNVICMVIAMIVGNVLYWKGKKDEEGTNRLATRTDYMLTGVWFACAVYNLAVLMGGLTW